MIIIIFFFKKTVYKLKKKENFYVHPNDKYYNY